MKIDRTKTNQIRIGNIKLGHQNRVLIQSMCNIKTENYLDVVQQINECALLGADLMRVSIMDEKDAEAISKIKPLINIPLCGDIHFDYRLAILAIENGIDKIRINPGNIGPINKIKLVVDACKKNRIPIRIGVNSGSFDKEIHNYDHKYQAKDLLDSAKKHIHILEELDFHDYLVSLKGSDVLETIEAYRLASQELKCPLHLGITEAGIKDIGVIRSCAGLAPLLLEGIGDTIRISLSDTPQEEIKICKRLLHDLGLYENYPTLISCPTCGRTQVDVKLLAEKILTYIEKINKPIVVAVMGCIVNGPGEAKNADIGIAGGKHEWVIFKKDQLVKKTTEENAYKDLINEINKL